jgi:FdhD protein
MTNNYIAFKAKNLNTEILVIYNMIKTAANGISTSLVTKYRAKGTSTDQDYIAVEEPLEISISKSSVYPKSKHNISVTMRTPGQDLNLAAGFLLTEGILSHKNQILTHAASDNRINIEVHPDTPLDMNKLQRHFYTTSSCGVCGKASIESIKTIEDYTPTHHQMIINNAIIYSLPTKLREQQKVFIKTGGLHAAALFDSEGNILDIAEDVGRHNALDKLIGSYFLKGQLPLDDKILLLSGRISFELVQKSVMAGIQCIVAVGAPSSLAIELAEEYDITLIGFASKERFNIYNGEHRINE